MKSPGTWGWGVQGAFLYVVRVKKEKHAVDTCLGRTSRYMDVKCTDRHITGFCKVFDPKQLVWQRYPCHLGQTWGHAPLMGHLCRWMCCSKIWKSFQGQQGWHQMVKLKLLLQSLTILTNKFWGLPLGVMRVKVNFDCVSSFQFGPLQFLDGFLSFCLLLGVIKHCL